MKKGTSKSWTFEQCPKCKPECAPMSVGRHISRCLRCRFKCAPGILPRLRIVRTISDNNNNPKYVMKEVKRAKWIETGAE
jgi:hypothetical protein